MREWLLRLLGAPRPIVIEFDPKTIAHARPGDVVVFTSPVLWSPEIMRSLQEQIASKILPHAPEVVFVINNPEWQTIVVPEPSRATGVEK